VSQIYPSAKGAAFIGSLGLMMRRAVGAGRWDLIGAWALGIGISALAAVPQALDEIAPLALEVGI
jgi:hypothetical protein